MSGISTLSASVPWSYLALVHVRPNLRERLKAEGVRRVSQRLEASAGRAQRPSISPNKEAREADS